MQIYSRGHNVCTRTGWREGCWTHGGDEALGALSSQHISTTIVPLPTHGCAGHVHTPPTGLRAVRTPFLSILMGPQWGVASAGYMSPPGNCRVGCQHRRGHGTCEVQAVSPAGCGCPEQACASGAPWCWVVSTRICLCWCQGQEASPANSNGKQLITKVWLRVKGSYNRTVATQGHSLESGRQCPQPQAAAHHPCPGRCWGPRHSGLPHQLRDTSLLSPLESRGHSTWRHQEGRTGSPASWGRLAHCVRMQRQCRGAGPQATSPSTQLTVQPQPRTCVPGLGPGVAGLLARQSGWGSARSSNPGLERICPGHVLTGLFFVHVHPHIQISSPYEDTARLA